VMPQHLILPSTTVMVGIEVFDGRAADTAFHKNHRQPQHLPTAAEADIGIGATRRKICQTLHSSAARMGIEVRLRGKSDSGMDLVADTGDRGFTDAGDVVPCNNAAPRPGDVVSALS